MSFAVRKDGRGWRAVDGPESCTEDEVWQEKEPADPVIPEPTPQEKLDGFLEANPDVAALLN